MTDEIKLSRTVLEPLDEIETDLGATTRAAIRAYETDFMKLLDYQKEAFGLGVTGKFPTGGPVTVGVDTAIGKDMTSVSLRGKHGTVIMDKGSEFVVPLGCFTFTSCNPPGIGKTLTVDMILEQMRSESVSVPRRAGKTTTERFIRDIESSRIANAGFRGQTFMGLKVLTDRNMTETVEDWSNCRSPARARRRLKRGFPQHVEYRSVPMSPVRAGEYIIMHPDTWRRLRLEVGNNRHRDTFEIMQVVT